MSDFLLRLQGKRLITLQLIYYLPDYPSLLQEFLWQADDVPPKFPRVRRFLAFWRREIEAPIHSVTLVCNGSISGGDYAAKSLLE